MVSIKVDNVKSVKITESISNGTSSKDRLLLKTIKKTSRKEWANNIKKTISKYKEKEDVAVLYDFLDDSDLKY